MLSRSHRLPLRVMPEAFRTFHKMRSQSLQVLWFPREFGLCRGAVVVPSTVAPLSTKRNEIKRALRSTLYAWFVRYPIERQPVDIVVFVRSQNTSTLAEELDELLIKIAESVQDA